MASGGDDPALEEEEKPDPVTLKPDLFEAAKANDADRVIFFLGEGVPPTYVDKASGWTPLHYAAMYGNIPMLKGLLEKGASEPYHRMCGRIGPRLKPEPSASSIDVQSVDESPKPEGADSSEAPVEEAPPVQQTAKELLQYDDTEEVAETDEQRLETSVNLRKNTPLLWAAFKGHMRAVWLFLVDNYSPNDVDNMDNNALHLAAVNGHVKILKALIDDGANANAVNFYKNRPVDMAMNKEIREALADAMVKGASFTATDIANKHDQNMRMYHRLTSNLTRALDDAKRVEGNRASVITMNLPETTRRLSDALRDAHEYSLDETLIVSGETLMQKLEATQDIFSDAVKLQQSLPVKNQNDYIEFVHKLERSMERAEAAKLDQSQLVFARELIARSNIEFWIEMMSAKVREVQCARDEHEHDMNCLKKAIQKAQALRASDEVIDAAAALHARLDGELTMSRALAAIPNVRLPIENPPEGYWQDCDTGKVKETEEFPLPPADGVYIWEPAEAYVVLLNAVENLKDVFNGAEERGVNPVLLSEVRTKLFMADKELKLLEAKDAADKQLAIDAATKLAKKLKKGKGKKKK